MSESVLREHREGILGAAGRHGATNVRIFGSFARRQASATSDLDLLVVLEEGRSLLDLVGLKQEVEGITGRRVDVVTERALSPFLRDRVLSEAIPL